MIERIVTVRSKIKSVTTVLPGYQERLSPTSLVRWYKHGSTSFTETHLLIASDDEIGVAYQDYTEYANFFGEPRTISLSKHEINDHHIKSDRTIFGRVVLFEWVPSITHIDPLQEKAIQELIETDVYTETTAQEVRDQMIYEAQQRRRLLPPKK